MTLKIEIDVPKGATKIDIGPALEPILARLVRLERTNGYSDLDYHGDYVWKHVSEKTRPVLEANIVRWLTWAKRKRETDRRISALSHRAITTFLKKEGWKKREHTHEENADWDRSVDYPGTQRCETWDYNFMKRPGWGGSQTPFKSRVTSHVPFPERYKDEARRIYLIKQTIKDIKKARFDDRHSRCTTRDVLAEIEACLHPLEHLADCAEDE